MVRWTLQGSEENLYFPIPILSYIRPVEFVESYLSMGLSDWLKVIWVFSDRYKQSHISVKLLDEKGWLESLLIELDKQITILLDGLKKYRLENQLKSIVSKASDELKSVQPLGNE